jgi:hypothetical protein
MIQQKREHRSCLAADVEGRHVNRDAWDSPRQRSKSSIGQAAATPPVNMKQMQCKLQQQRLPFSGLAESSGDMPGMQHTG